MVMESINVVIDDAITNVANDDSGEGKTPKKLLLRLKPKMLKWKNVQWKENLLPRTLEWRQDHCLDPQALSPLRTFILLSLGMMKCSPQRSHHLEWLKIIRKVTLSIF